MSGDLISRSALLADINNQRRLSKTSFPKRSFVVGDTIHCIYDAPTVDAVSMEVHKQVQWERDCAIEQLKEHGIPFGGKADVVKVVRCKDCFWFDTQGYEEANEDKESGLEFGYCRLGKRETQACEFCSHGERKTDERKAD